MTSERVLRHVERILAQANEALAKRQWDLVRDCATDVLALDHPAIRGVNLSETRPIDLSIDAVWAVVCNPQYVSFQRLGVERGQAAEEVLQRRATGRSQGHSHRPDGPPERDPDLIRHDGLGRERQANEGQAGGTGNRLTGRAPALAAHIRRP